MKRYRIWLVCAGCMIYYGTLVGVLNNCFGVLISAIMTAEGYTSSAFSGFYSLKTVSQAISLLLTSKMLQKYRFKLVAFGVAAVASLSMVLMYFYNASWLWNFSGILYGFGCSLCMLIPTTIVNNWFVKNKGTVMGIVTMLSGVFGMIMSPIISRYILAHGWRNTALTLGIVSFILFFSALLMERKPSDVGAIPYGGDGTETESEQKPAEKDLPKEKKPVTWKEAVVYLFILLTVSMAGKGAQITSYIPQYSTSLGYPLTVGGTLTSAVMIGNFSSKLLFGVVCDWLGVWHSLQLFLGLLCLAYVLLCFFGGTLPVLYVACVLLGFSYIIGIALSMSSIRLFPPEEFAARYSRASMLNTMITIPIPLFISFVFDHTGSFKPVFIYYAVSMLVAIVIVGLRDKLKVTAR